MLGKRGQSAALVAVLVVASLLSVSLELRTVQATTSGTRHTYNSTDYYVAILGGREITLSSNTTGIGFAIPQPSSLTIRRTLDGGQNWTSTSLPTTPLTDCGPFVDAGGTAFEGDISMAPNGDLLVFMDTTTEATLHVWRSTDNGASFSCVKYLATSIPGGPSLAPDRGWIVTSTRGTGLFDPPYISEIQAGISLPSVGGGFGKVGWASVSGGTAWFVTDAHVHSTIPGDFARHSDTYLNRAKPMAQGFNTGTQLVALSDGALYSPAENAWTTDFATWYKPVSDILNWPAFDYVNLLPDTIERYAWWDMSSDGILFAGRVHNVSGTWQFDYKWYDGTWHTGGATASLAAKPAYGLVDGRIAAMKSFGSTLGINTREGDQDVLIRIRNATSASPTVTKDLLGPPAPAENGMPEFPNLAFDSAGRALATMGNFSSVSVAYALTS